MKSFGVQILAGGAAMALASCGQAASKEAPAATSTRSYAVAGLSPGMSPAAVEAKMTSSGYVEEQYKRPARTFQEEVTAARGGDAFTSTGPGDVSYRKGGESVTVTYIGMPSGPLVKAVTYSAGSGIMTLAQVEAEMVRRYGRAPIVQGQSMLWCRSGIRDCDRREPFLLVSQLTDHPSVVVEDPTFRERQREAVRNAPGAQRTTM